MILEITGLKLVGGCSWCEFKRQSVSYTEVNAVAAVRNVVPN